MPLRDCEQRAICSRSGAYWQTCRAVCRRQVTAGGTRWHSRPADGRCRAPPSVAAFPLPPLGGTRGSASQLGWACSWAAGSLLPARPAAAMRYLTACKLGDLQIFCILFSFCTPFFFFFSCCSAFEHACIPTGPLQKSNGDRGKASRSHPN